MKLSKHAQLLTRRRAQALCGGIRGMGYIWHMPTPRCQNSGHAHFTSSCQSSARDSPLRLLLQSCVEEKSRRDSGQPLLRAGCSVAGVDQDERRDFWNSETILHQRHRVTQRFTQKQSPSRILHRNKSSAFFVTGKV